MKVDCNFYTQLERLYLHDLLVILGGVVELIFLLVLHPRGKEIVGCTPSLVTLRTFQLWRTTEKIPGLWINNIIMGEGHSITPEITGLHLATVYNYGSNYTSTLTTSISLKLTRLGVNQGLPANRHQRIC